ncbi:hypothetical protein ACQZWC_004591 [Enterobacter bugandensis]
MPGLHRIWTDVSDGQLAVLAAEFPGFRALAIMTEAAWLAEQSKTSRSYDNMPVFGVYWGIIPVALINMQVNGYDTVMASLCLR